SGCEAVTGTVYGKPLGVPLALIGAVGFATLFGLTLFPTARAFALVAPLTVLAGLVAVGLIAIQALVLNRFCELCLFTDVAAVVAAGLVFYGRVWRNAGPELSRKGRLAWALGAGFVALVPFLIGLASAEDVPEEVKAQWVDGTVTQGEV